MPAGLLPEDELCLLLARAHLSPEARMRVADLVALPFRWDALWQRAEEHQVLPLLYRNLLSLEFHGVPGEVQAKLGENFRLNAVRAMLFVAELRRLLGLLREAGIRAIPLKGVALAQALYGDPAFRTCSDTDILVPADEAVRARRLLLAHGYTSFFTEDFFLKHQFSTSADCPLTARRGGLSYFLELHWTLLQHSSVDRQAMQDIWSSASPQEFFGAPGYGLSPEWQFLYLAAHAAYHRWQTLKWVADLHDLCASTAIDWPVVRAKAAQFHLEFAVGTTLTVCSLLYGMPPPAGLSPLPLPAGVKLYPHSLDSEQAWDAPLFYPQLLQRPAEKLRWFLEMFFVARMADRLAFPLPESLEFLYYFLRPLRLSWKWSRLLLAAGVRKLRQRWAFPTRPTSGRLSH